MALTLKPKFLYHQRQQPWKCHLRQLPSPTVVVIARHAERVDRAFEATDRDWISFASRPHDPPLSVHGRLVT